MPIDHVGVHPQVDGKFYVGAAPIAGRVSGGTLVAVAKAAERAGSGRVRLTPQQKLVVLDVPEDQVPTLQAELAELGLETKPSPWRRSVMACTGLEFCKLAIVETKARAQQLVADLEKSLADIQGGLDTPVTVHLNGCPNSCARIQTADIGLKGQIVTDADGNQVEGFQVHLGGGLGLDAGFGRKLRGHKVTSSELTGYVERVVRELRRRTRARRAVPAVGGARRGKRAAVTSTERAVPVLLPLLRGRGPAAGRERRLAVFRLSPGFLGEVPRTVPPGGVPMTATADYKTLAERASKELADATADEAIRWTVDTFGDDFIVASNMQDAVLIDLATKVKSDVDVLFLETGYHFPETIGTRDAVQTVYPDVKIVNAQAEQSVAEQDARVRREAARPRPDAVLQPAQGRAAAQDPGELLGVGHRRAPGRRADPGEHPDRHLGRPQRPGEGQPDRGVDRRRVQRPTSPSTGSWRTRWSRSATCRSAARPARLSVEPGQDPRSGRWAGSVEDRVRTARLRKGRMTTLEPATDAAQDNLAALESEAIHIFREVAGEFDRPVILFSGGKDSTLLLHLAIKAFWPAPVPFPLLHVDTGHNFDEVIEFRDRVVERHGLRLVVAKVQDWIDDGRLEERAGRHAQPAADHAAAWTPSRRTSSTRCSAAAAATRSGPARRSGSSASATPSASGSRAGSGPSCGTSTTAGTARASRSASSRCPTGPRPDVWNYIEREKVELPSIYYAHQREVYLRDGMWLTEGPWGGPRPGEEVRELTVRYRTVGDGSCTGAIESTATTVEDVIAEVSASRLTERGATRADDRMSEAAMEDRKREGYF